MSLSHSLMYFQPEPQQCPCTSTLCALVFHCSGHHSRVMSASFHSSFSILIIVISSHFLTVLLHPLFFFALFLLYLAQNKLTQDKIKKTNLIRLCSGEQFDHGQSCRSRKKCQIKQKQLHLWMDEVIDHILFQFNIVPQARGFPGCSR